MSIKPENRQLYCVSESMRNHSFLQQFMSMFPNTDPKTDNMELLFFKAPGNDAPWIARSKSGFYMGIDTKVVQIGMIDQKYRNVNGKKQQMTKGNPDEEWTAETDGIIYRLHNNEFIQVGKTDIRWVTPCRETVRMDLPMIMSMGNDKTPWIGEYGGIIYMEVLLIQ
jgi:hypothetical protein